MPLDADGFSAFLNLNDSLQELELIAGPKARPVIAAIRDGLAQAVAKRQIGDVEGAFSLIRLAMQKVAVLGSDVDSEEGAMMRLMAERFGQAFSAGDKSEARAAVNLMRHKAGDPKDSDSEW
ncbi:MAG: hypothetical protein ABSG46_08640 [Candidatus Binataceae bacterium]|jgi:hypothetical protein